TILVGKPVDNLSLLLSSRGFVSCADGLPQNSAWALFLLKYSFPYFTIRERTHYGNRNTNIPWSDHDSA
ncbi:hypothetical protein RZS08_43405, partial [Arthrospira platensis SPKY1]|nr:hypothetical protein [Arthrospira platensis SPKY1]